MAEPSRPVTVRMQRAASTAGVPGQAVHSALDAHAEHGLPLSTADASHRYTVLGELGRGGMGVALRVFDTVLCRQLAMKVLSSEPNPAGDEGRKDLVKRFVDEARVTGSLEHPGIVPVHDLHAEPDGRIYFTMPIIEGVDLGEVILCVAKGDKEWTLPRAVGVILKVCEAVAFAHSRGVLHRDLTPANVRIGKFGEVHVIDWGLAKVLGRLDRTPVEGPQELADSERRPAPVGNGPALTLDGTVLGTPAYMPPEQAEGRLEDISARSDVYAAGALLYHLLAGAAPFTSQRRTLLPERILRLVRRGGPPAIERFNRHAPRELVAIAEKAMSRRPEDRYVDMNAMAADLRAYIECRVVPAYERGGLARLRKMILRNRTTSLLVTVAAVAIVYNLVEFAVKHFTDNDLFAAHNAELRVAQDEAIEATQRAESMRTIAQQHGERLRKALATLPAGSARHAEFATLLAELERATKDAR